MKGWTNLYSRDVLGSSKWRQFWGVRILRVNTFQEINISHLGKRKIIFKYSMHMPFQGDMWIPRRVIPLLKPYEGIYYEAHHSSLDGLQHGDVVVTTSGSEVAMMIGGSQPMTCSLATHTHTHKRPHFFGDEEVLKKSKKRDLWKKHPIQKSTMMLMLQGDFVGCLFTFVDGKTVIRQKFLACWRPGLNSKNPIP